MATFLLGDRFRQREHCQPQILGVLQNLTEGRGGAGISIIITRGIKMVKANDDQSFLIGYAALDTAFDNICWPAALIGQIAQSLAIERMMHGKV